MSEHFHHHNLVVHRKMELWSFTSALGFIVFLTIIIFALVKGITTLIDFNNIKKDWASHRCNPMIMPFASIFGFNTVENFNFCLGKIFNTHSQSSFGSIGSMFSSFTSILQNIFGSISSLRNTIATLGGGINVVFQEFTDRITNFFFKLRMSAIRLKMLFGRMYATLFSVMYMGMSGITGMSSFTNTYLFSFLDTFCFPGDTPITIVEKGTNEKKGIPIKDVKIGDVLMPGHTTVTATFRFYSRGQPMVKIGSVVVSTNHYIIYNGKAIKAVDHPHAISMGPWDSDELLYCLNTDTNRIPVSYLTFLDYDETSEGDQETMKYVEERINAPEHTACVEERINAPEYTACVEERINASEVQKETYPFKEYGFAISETIGIKTANGIVAAKDIKMGEKLENGSTIIGVIRRKMNEVCTPFGDPTKIVTPSTLYWDQTKWTRFGETHSFVKKPRELLSFVAVPSSQIELEDGTIVRDYMELCSPDAEIHYSKHIEMGKNL